MGIRYKVDKDFFKSWSSKMSYVLGFIAADGSLEDAPYLRGKYLRIYSSDKEIIDKIKTALRSEHRTVIRKSEEFFDKRKRYACKEKYMLRIGSHEIYNDLIKLGITPCKSQTLKFINAPLEYLAHFIRGYLDGDGCIYYCSKKKRLRVIFTSGSKIFLEGLSQAISFLCGVKRHNILDSNRAFQLWYSTKEAVRLLGWIYGLGLGDLFLTRKHNIYRNFIDRYPKWNFDRKIEGAVADQLGNGLQNRFRPVQLRFAPPKQSLAKSCSPG